MNRGGEVNVGVIDRDTGGERSQGNRHGFPFDCNN